MIKRFIENMANSSLSIGCDQVEDQVDNVDLRVFLMDEQVHDDNLKDFVGVVDNLSDIRRNVDI